MIDDLSIPFRIFFFVSITHHPFTQCTLATQEILSQRIIYNEASQSVKFFLLFE